MRFLTILILATLPAIGAAQQQTTSNEYDAVTYVIRIDDTQLEALRNGKSLESMVPAEHRGKFGIIRIEYVPTPASNQPANTSGTGGNFNLGSPNNTNSPTTNNANSNNSTIQPPPLSQPNQPNAQNPGNNSPPLWNPPTTNRNHFDNSTTQNGQPSNGWLWGTRNPNQQSELTPLANGDQSSIVQNRGNSILSSPMAGFDRNQRASRNDDYDWDLLRRRGDEIESAYSSPPTGPQMLSVSSLPVYEPGVPASSGLPTADQSPSESLGKLTLPPTKNEETLTAQVTELTAKNKDQSKRMWFLFLFLMCSLGANIYLGWIARGFYTRFHEMAAELRDTFSGAGAA